MKVQILSRKTITPSSPTPYHLRTHNLSFFDQLAPRYHLPYVYFYAGHDNDGNHRDMAKMDEVLEKSLSETLSLFCLLAGRFAEDGLTVNCHDQGVEYTRAQVKFQLDEFLQKAYKDANLMNYFVPWDIREPIPDTTPLLGIQVTTFECGGLALTFHGSHIVSDAFSSNTFMNAWATISRQGVGSVIFSRPSFELGSLFPARKTMGLRVPPLKNNLPRIVSKIFVFDAVAISNLKKEASADSSSMEIQPSKVGVVTALIWRSLVRVNQAKHGGSRRSSTLTLAVNLRGRTAMPTPLDGFGNFIAPVPLKFTAHETKMELHKLVRLIRDGVSNVQARCLKALDVDDVFRMIVELRKEVQVEFCNDQTDFYICTSWCRFPFYEVDFGWGKPSWVSGGNPTTQMFLLMDTNSGTGIEAKVSLNQRDMDAFERDPDIMAFTCSLH